MPYSADLRCSWFVAELNTSWFYTFMDDDYHIEFEFENECEHRMFEDYIECCFTDYTHWKLFDHNRTEYKMDIYCNVCEFLHDCVMNYADKHKLKLKHTDCESESDSESEAEAQGDQESKQSA